MKSKEQTKFDIKEIKSPDFVKDLSTKEVESLSKSLSEEIILAVSKNGGHLSSNLGVIDATIALCRSFDFSKDKIIFDVGHQCYAYKLLTGRSLDNLRKKNGISGFQKISESTYDHFEAGHSSTSISVANGFAMTRDFNKENYNVIAFIGDSSVVNGLALEGLNNASKRNKVIIVINDNDMSISRPTGGISELFRKFSASSFYRKSKHFYQRITKKGKVGKAFYSFGYNTKNWFKRHLIKMNLFENLGYAFIGPIDGHNVKAMEKAFNRAKLNDRSTVVLIKTIKGKGYKYAENDSVGSWHGVAPFDIETGKSLKEKQYNWSKAITDSLDIAMGINDKIITLVPGTGLGSELDAIFAKYKTRCIDVGIAEEHAATLAGAISINGYHPVISMYSTFSQRAYDEFSHDIARMNLNATLLLDRSGLVGNDGNTHQGIYDEAFLMSIPNTVITMPTCVNQIDSLIKESIKGHGLFAIRYPREEAKIADNKIDIPFGGWIKELEGKDLAIVSVGPDTKRLKELLVSNDAECSLYSAIYLYPIINNNIEELLAYKKVVIYDAYGTENGFAQKLVFELTKAGYKGDILVKAIPSIFVDQASIKEQKAEFGLLPEDVLKII